VLFSLIGAALLGSAIAMHRQAARQRATLGRSVTSGQPCAAKRSPQEAPTASGATYLRHRGAA